jgi:ABC-type glycerol-3-phosphate transport system substrate-binding protein
MDVEVAAFAAGDGEQFFTTFPEDTRWRFAQLLPQHQAFYRGNPTVISAERHGADVWALMAWSDGVEEWQRLAFFREWSGSLIRVRGVVDYWGELEERATSWGTLVSYERDASWAAQIAAFVAAEVAQHCRGTCVDTHLPLQLMLAADDATTMAPNEVRLASPHLLALDAAGEPGAPFWSALRRELVSYFEPARLRFALPDEVIARNEVGVFAELAAQFSADNPDISVEVVDLSSWNGDLATALPFIDGAAVAPDEALVATGMVFDLTDYVFSDPGFDDADFYEQIWQGAWWSDRMWFMPLAASQRLIYYDRKAVERLGLIPDEHWTWRSFDEMLAAMAAAGAFEWALVDGSRDLLFAYAFSNSYRCSGATAMPHTVALHPAGVAAAYEWYRQQTALAGIMPDLSNLEPEERAFRVTNIIAPRRAGFWVDEPVRYEAHRLRQAVGVAPFPGQGNLPGITPLTVHGAVISQFSEHPRAMWAWLKFLSYQNVRRQLRWVPARPSVADTTGYWSTLPTPLASLLRASFPCTRPLRIGEQNAFSWEDLAEVTAGKTTPAAAAGERPRVRWFFPEAAAEALR